MYTVFDEVHHYIDIKEIYQSYTGYSLTKNGNDWTGLCPFHNDKTAGNFKIRKNRYFKCYTCNQWGDMLDLVGKLFDITKKLDCVRKVNTDFNLGLDLDSFNSTPNKARQEYMKAKEDYEVFNQWIKVTYHQMTEEYKKIQKSLREELLDDDTFAAYVLRLGDLDWWTDLFIQHPSNCSVKDFKSSELFQLREYLNNRGEFFNS